MIRWTTEDFERMKKTLATSRTLAEAAESLGVSRDTLETAFRRRLGHSAGRYLSKAPPPPGLPEAAPRHDFARLVELAKKKAPLAKVCDELDISPRKLQALVAEARAAGYIVDLTQSTIILETPRVNDEQTHDLGVPPVVGGWNWFANISDLHFGSHYCLRAQIVDFVKYAYRRGVRHITMSGDCLDGCYGHGKYELSHNGLEAQTDDMLTTLPRLDGLRYYGITGNHEQTFAAQVGLNVGQYIEGRAKIVHGRDDIRFFGGRSAYLNLLGTRVHLYHPGGGSAYAKSYKIQKKVESYAPGRKPDILFVGHYHQAIYVVDRGVHAFMASSFQGGGSDFAKSLMGNGDIGGWILKFRVTEHGTIRDLVPHKRTYFERETVHHIDVEAAE